MRFARQSGKQSLTHLKHGTKWALLWVPEMWSTVKCSTPSPQGARSISKARLALLGAITDRCGGARAMEGGVCLTKTEITGRNGCAKAFTGKVSEERWRQREHWLPKHKGTKESDTFWVLELFSFPGPLGVCGEDHRQGWEGGARGWGSGTGLCTLQRRFVLARGA